jgi:hypothetical protein
MFVVIGAGQPASGQSSREVVPGSLISQPKAARIPDKPGLSEAERGRIAVAAFADCAIVRRKQDVAAFITAPYSSRESRQAMSNMAVSACLSDGRLMMPPPLMRGALFRAVYNRDYAQSEVMFAAAAPDYTSSVTDTMNVDDATQVLMLDFASCVIRSNRDGAKDMLLARVGSDKEKAAFSSLVPSMGACFPKGKSVELSKSMATAVIAEAMYREAQAGSTGFAPPSGKK